MCKRYRQLLVAVLFCATPTLFGCGQKGPLYLADESGQPVEEEDGQIVPTQKQGISAGSYQGGFLPER